jgi:V/A-type H+-transporting ATPase subunit D
VGMEKISPTRRELLLKKEEIKLVKDGIELLRNKKDALLKEFFLSVKALSILRNQLEGIWEEAIISLISLLGFEGKEKVISHSFISVKDIEIEFYEKNMWGVKVPEFKGDLDKFESETGEIDISLHMETTKEKFWNFIKLAMKVLPEEIKIKRLGKEIKSTSRKINYLEKFVLPALYEQIKFIYQTLEELEYEEIFRLKRLKKKIIY